MTSRMTRTLWRSRVATTALVVTTALAAGQTVSLAAPRAASRAAPVTYYVSSGAGNDQSDGTTSTTAWKSLSKVNQTVLDPGAGDGASPTLYGGSNHWSATGGNTAKVAFSGTKITYFSSADDNEGIVAVSVDGGAETLVDLYSVNRAGNVPVWSSPTLSAGSHVLTVRVTGTANAAASAAFVVVDRFDVIA